MQRANVTIFDALANRRYQVDDAMPSSFFAGHGFLLVHAHRDATLSLRPGLASIWSPLRGEALFAAADCKAVLRARSIFVADSQRQLTVAVGSASRCVGVVATQAAWSRLLEPWVAVAAQECALIPAAHATSRAVRRRILRLVHEVRADSAGAARQDSLWLLASIVNDLQLGFQRGIERCPGHSLAKRRAVFLRLQRAKNHIEFSPTKDFNVGKLALIANYSIWRFIKVFCRVYGETPYACVSRSRAEHARRLLENSELAVGDVGIASGFDSRASFARVIKRHLGQPASAIRRAARIDIAV
ncbi:MAG TPA: AraC family transcriptional regulator [Rudaea sp.]|nr:AraC family transcriptional regulator [Rudaea sp.]